jgi:predicted NodU family carbamoyl transferase
MVILGINGFEDWFHDPAATILVDGRLVLFVEEERLCRRKHAPGIPPRLAVEACLRAAAVGWGDVDRIALGWDVPALLRFAGQAHSPREVAARLLRSLGAPPFVSTDRVEFVPHHDAHAWSVVGLYPERPALVVVADGQGEHASTSVYRHERGNLRRLVALGPRFSLGYFFEAASAYVGLGLDGAGKLMGLAAYATDARAPAFPAEDGTGYGSPVPEAIVATMSEDLDHAVRVCDAFWRPYLARAFPDVVSGSPAAGASFYARDALHAQPAAVAVAAFAQRSVEYAMVALIRRFLEPTDTAVALAGGVALNCSMNGVVASAIGDRALVVQPASNDAGVALGAALAGASAVGRWPIDLAGYPWSGEPLDTGALDAQLAGTCWHRSDDVAGDVAGMLANNLVVGWLQGRAEAGPRALGARSILARADDALVARRVNQRIKRREQWRPLAPAVLDEAGPQLFAPYQTSPFMLVAQRVADQGLPFLRGTTHVDQTARPQSVTAAGAPRRYAALLEAMVRRTGVPAVLDTSFNLAGEPIVYSVADALSTFRRSELDALVIEDRVVRRS